MAKLVRAAQAGTVESNDIMISVSPAESGSGCQVILVSPVLKQYGRQITAVIEAVVKEKGIEDILVHANDKGALDCTIKARLNVALQRALIPEEVTNL
ncbi:MAG: citrate lyase acyl carrier protein [Negativicutes bacterium]